MSGKVTVYLGRSYKIRESSAVQHDQQDESGVKEKRGNAVYVGGDGRAYTTQYHDPSKNGEIDIIFHLPFGRDRLCQISSKTPIDYYDYVKEYWIEKIKFKQDCLKDHYYNTEDMTNKKFARIVSAAKKNVASLKRFLKKRKSPLSCEQSDYDKRTIYCSVPNMLETEITLIGDHTVIIQQLLGIDIFLYDNEAVKFAKSFKVSIPAK